MPDTSPDRPDIDLAFASLAHDVMLRAAPPAAPVAIGRARRRRRTYAGIAAAAALVVAGIAMPSLAGSGSGTDLADGVPDAARLDAAALNEATQGWISDWDEGLGPPFGMPGCLDVPGVEVAGAVSLGTTKLAGQPSSGAGLTAWESPDPASLERAWDRSGAIYTDCADLAETDVADPGNGVEVRHWTAAPLPDDPGARLSDVWVARTPTRIGTLTVFTTAGSAPAPTVDAVADALVAGLLDGWTQQVEDPRDTLAVPRREQLPPFDDAGFKAAVADWRNPGRVEGASEALRACLPSIRGDSADSSGSSSWGGSYAVAGYLRPGPDAAEEVQAAAKVLRDCEVTQMTELTLPGGVTAFTYDLGTPDGHGAIWLAASADRAVTVAVDRASSPLPEAVGRAVADVVRRVLARRWAPAR